MGDDHGFYYMEELKKDALEGLKNWIEYMGKCIEDNLKDIE